jgi:transposase
MNFRPIAGIDIGKFFSEMVILSPTNQISCRMKVKHDSISDVERAVNLLRKAEKDFASKPFVVMESTGHYHKILFRYLCNAGYEVSVTNPIQTDSIKNIGIRKVKNDKVDARKIALLHRFQELRTTNIPNEDIECLKNLCRQYYNLNDELTAYKNRLTSVVDQIMLNYTDVFPNIFSKASIAVLEQYPTPVAILKANKSKLIALIKHKSRKSLESSTIKYDLLVSKAKEFAPLSNEGSSNVTMLKVYISMIKALEENLEKLMIAIRELIAEDAGKDFPVLSLTLELLQSFTGIDLLSAATLLAEIGDFSAFTKPERLVAFFGVDPSVMQSGEFTGTQNKMSKRGSRLLRRVLFSIALANIRTKRDKQPCNPVIMEYYKQKCQSKPKKVALGAVMRKIVCIIFAILRDKKPYEMRSPEIHAQMLNTKLAAAQ